MVRCFVGILLPDTLKTNVLKIQNLIKDSGVDCKFVEYENLHISLSFIGEIDDERVKSVIEKLNEIGRDFKKFTVSVSGMKFIPRRTYIRVIALDVIDNSGVLKSLVERIENSIGGDVKPPHLTMCRVRNVKNIHDAISELLSINSHCGDFEVSSVNLIKSELCPDGPVYSTLYESKLQIT